MHLGWCRFTNFYSPLSFSPPISPFPFPLSLPLTNRYGGPGNQRYPIGFSGDTYALFSTLQFEVYFTATAANILFGYWSHGTSSSLPPSLAPSLPPSPLPPSLHLLTFINFLFFLDSGGFRGEPSDELFLRWLQFAAVQPIYRIHSDHEVMAKGGKGRRGEGRGGERFKNKERRGIQ